MSAFFKTEVEYLSGITFEKKYNVNIEDVANLNVDDSNILKKILKPKNEYSSETEWITLGLSDEDLSEQLKEYVIKNERFNRIQNIFGLHFVELPITSNLANSIIQSIPSIFDPYRNDYFLPSKTEMLLPSDRDFSYISDKYIPEIIDAHKMINLPDDVKEKPSSELSVCIIDSGIDEEHPAFKGLFTRDENYKNFCQADIDQPFEYLDGISHGTHCASIFFGKKWVGKNGIEHSGVISGSGVKRFVAKVFSYNGGGANTLDILDALIWAAFENKVDVISLSLGGGLPDGKSVLTQAVNKCIKNGTFFSISAGNSTSDISPHSNITSPGDSNGLTVGALCKDYSLCPFSSKGDPTGHIYPVIAQKPDIVLPGGAISAAWSKDHPDNTNVETEIIYSGTSMAAPLGAGIASIIISTFKQNNEEYSPAEIKEVIMNISDKSSLSGSYELFEVGAGLPDLYKILVPAEKKESKMELNSTIPEKRRSILGIEHNKIKRGTILLNNKAQKPFAVYDLKEGGEYRIYIGIDLNKLPNNPQTEKHFEVSEIAEFISARFFDFSLLESRGFAFEKLDRALKSVYRVPKPETVMFNEDWIFEAIKDNLRIDHPQILKFKDYFQDADTSERFFMEVEYADLTYNDFTYSAFSKSCKELDEDFYIKMFRQLYEGLNKLKQEEFFAGDISPDNIFVFHENNKKEHVFKLGDFFPNRFAQKIKDEYRGAGFYNDFSIMAPEEFHQSFSIQSDIYRLTAIFYHWVTGKYPTTDSPKYLHRKDVTNCLSILNKGDESAAGRYLECLKEETTITKQEKENYYREIIEKNKIPFSKGMSEEREEALTEFFKVGLNPEWENRDLDRLLNILNDMVPTSDIVDETYEPENKQEEVTPFDISIVTDNIKVTPNSSEKNNGTIVSPDTASPHSFFARKGTISLITFTAFILIFYFLGIPRINIQNNYSNREVTTSEILNDTLWVQVSSPGLFYDIDNLLLKVDDVQKRLYKRTDKMFYLPLRDILSNEIITQKSIKLLVQDNNKYLSKIIKDNVTIPLNIESNTEIMDSLGNKEISSGSKLLLKDYFQYDSLSNYSSIIFDISGASKNFQLNPTNFQIISQGFTIYPTYSNKIKSQQEQKYLAALINKKTKISNSLINRLGRNPLTIKVDHIDDKNNLYLLHINSESKGLCDKHSLLLNNLKIGIKY